MKSFLSVTSLEWGNDTSADKIIYSEHGCVKHRKKERWEEVFVDSNPEIYYNVKLINENIDKHEERLLPIIMMNLNELHHVDFNEKQWRCILSYWFDYYLDAMYQKYILIKGVIDKYDVYSFALSSDSFSHPSYNKGFFKWVLTNEEYNFQLYSHVLEFLKVEIREYVTNPLMDKKKYILDEDKEINQFGKIRTNTLILNPKDFSLNIIERQLLKLLSKRRIDFLEINSSNVPQVNYDVEYRKQLRMKMCGNENEFEKLILTYFFQDIPAVLLEGFQKMKKIVCGVFAEKVIHADVGDAYETAQMLLSTRCKRVYSIPYGGDGNLHMGRNEAMLHSEITDVLYTTGWRNQYRAILKTITIPRLYRAEKKRKKVKKVYDILYIGGPVYAYRFTGVNRGSYASHLYSQDSIAFLNQLEKKKIHRNISARFFSGNSGWKLVEKMKELNPNIHIDYMENTMLEEVSKARLCVVDYVGTAWVEVLASNTPLVMIIPEYVDFLSEAGREIKKQLSEVGIWHSSYSDAIDYICDMQTSLEEWWNVPTRQLAVKKVMSLHGHIAKNVKLEWYKEFLRISKE